MSRVSRQHSPCGPCLTPGHSFLLLLVTVRDAAARLPNGEGTRAEICELLKDSQFLAPDVTSTQVGLGPSQVKDCLQGGTNLVMCHGGGWWATPGGT